MYVTAKIADKPEVSTKVISSFFLGGGDGCDFYDLVISTEVLCC